MGWISTFSVFLCVSSHPSVTISICVIFIWNVQQGGGAYLHLNLLLKKQFWWDVLLWYSIIMDKAQNTNLTPFVAWSHKLESCSRTAICAVTFHMKFTYRGHFLQDVVLAEDAELDKSLPKESWRLQCKYKIGINFQPKERMFPLLLLYPHLSVV